MNKFKAIILFFLSTFYLYTPKIIPKINQIPNSVENVVSTIAPKPTIIRSDNLPNYYLINTFFISQAPEKDWSEPWQDACEEAAILTVKYYYYHQSPDQNQVISDFRSIFSFEAENGPTGDLNTSQMATISATMFKFKPTIISNPDMATFKEYLSKDIPIIIPADGKILFKENSHFKSGGPWYHNLVVLGYDDDRQQFIVHDVGTQFGAYFRYSYGLLLDSIHDFPSGGKKEDIASGAKNILVLIK